MAAQRTINNGSSLGFGGASTGFHNT